jgi:putative transposase
MPRAARIKHPAAIYHVMSRSISEFDMFTDNSDKEYFLDLLQKCKEKFDGKIYGYCLMTNHYHLIIDTCGYDISKFMKSLNQTYVRYINKKYNRRGHLLTERFNSKIIDTDEYLLTVSAYIHNNVKDLPEFNGQEYDYSYSSMGIYLNKKKDKRNLVDTDFILRNVNESDKVKAIQAYKEMVIERRDAGINTKLGKYLEEFTKEQYAYKSNRYVLLREKNPEEVIKAIANAYGINDISKMMHRWKRNTMEFRQVVAYILTVYCGLKIIEVCRYMCNITASCCAKLVDKGFEHVNKKCELKSILVGG